MRLKNAIGFAFGPVATAALGIVTVPVTAWTFSPDDIGRFSVFQVVTSFLLLFSVLGLDQAYVREYHEAADKEALLKACLVPGLLVVLMIEGASMFFLETLARLLYGLANPWLCAVTLLVFLMLYFSRFLSLILRMQERGLAFSMSQVLPKVLQLAMISGIAVAAFHREFIHLLLISLVSFFFVLAIYAWNTREQWQRAIKSRVDPAQLRELLAFGLPLIFSGLAYWGLTATSTFALRGLSTLSELAVYSVATSFAGAAAVFQSIFSAVWAPTVYKWVAKGADMERVDAVAQQALAIVCAIIVGCGSFAWLADWLLPAQYTQVKYVLLCTVVQPLLYTLSEVTCIGMYISRRTIWSLWITLTAMGANIVMSIALIPRYGAAGAAIANALAFLVFFVARTEASAWVWRQFPRRRIYFFVSLAVALSVLTVFYGPALPFHFSFAWLALVPLTAIVFYNQWRDTILLLCGRHALPELKR